MFLRVLGVQIILKYLIIEKVMNFEKIFFVFCLFLADFCSLCSCLCCYEGFGWVSNGMVVEGILGYNKDLKAMPYDPEAAKQYLAAAGYGPGELKIEFMMDMGNGVEYMVQEDKKLDLSQLKDTDPIISYEESEEAELVEFNSTWDNIVNTFKHNPLATAGAVIIVVIILAAVLAPWICPYDPYVQNLQNALAKPSGEHLLGTDCFGRDLFTRIIYGARISLVIGLIPSVIALVIGTVLGLMAGFLGKTADFIIMRLADIVLSFPSLLLAMVIMYTMGASLLNLFIALSIINWGMTARTVRAQTLQLREKEFVEAARSVGVKNWTIMFRHILPNCIPSLIVIFTLDIPSAIMSEASLSFLGVGATPPQASWGLMVSENKEYLSRAPWVALVPGIAIMLLVLAFNFVGDGLRDALDPTLKE